MIVGFPGETDRDVEVLTDFLPAARLDVVGVFGYSDEDGTEAAGLDGQLAEQVIEERDATSTSWSSRWWPIGLPTGSANSSRCWSKNRSTVWPPAARRTKDQRSTASSSCQGSSAPVGSWVTARVVESAGLISSAQLSLGHRSPSRGIDLGERGGQGAVSSWNLPNALTVIRLLLVPVFVVVAWVGFERDDQAWQAWAALIFLAAAITDLLDGELARRTGKVTSFGKIADPIADKALTGAALIVLSWFTVLPWWVTIVIIVREVAVTVLRFWVIRHGVMAASRGGKLKTALQIVAITLYLLPLASGAVIVAQVVMAAAVIVTLLTGVDYVLRARALRRAETASRWAPARERGRQRLAAALVPALHERGLTVAVAESLTGGLVMATLTEIPGASAVLRGGPVVYATDTKASELGIDAELLVEPWAR